MKQHLKPKTFAVIYGIAEGNFHARKFISTCASHGLTLSDTEDADIIFAHSGGCFVVPVETNAKILLIGVSPWNGINTFACLIKKLQSEPPTLIELFWHVVYLLAKPRHNYRMLKRKDLPNSKKSQVIWNKDDVYFPQSKAMLLEAKCYRVHTFDGGHDDIWHNPAKYIELVV